MVDNLFARKIPLRVSYFTMQKLVKEELHKKNAGMIARAYNSSAEAHRNKQISRACYPGSLLQRVISRFYERLCLKIKENRRGRQQNIIFEYFAFGTCTH